MAATAAYMDTPSATAAATAAAATMSAAAATMSAATAAATAAAASQSKLFSERGCSGIFLVEDMERRQADVREFLLAKKEFVTLGGRWCIR